MVEAGFALFRRHNGVAGEIGRFTPHAPYFKTTEMVCLFCDHFVFIITIGSVKFSNVSRIYTFSTKVNISNR